MHSLPHTCEVAGFKSDVIFLKADFSGAVAGKIINVSFVPLFPPISNGTKLNHCFPDTVLREDDWSLLDATGDRIAQLFNTGADDLIGAWRWRVWLDHKI